MLMHPVQAGTLALVYTPYSVSIIFILGLIFCWHRILCVSTVLRSRAQALPRRILGRAVATTEVCTVATPRILEIARIRLGAFAMEEIQVICRTEQPEGDEVGKLRCEKRLYILSSGSCQHK